MDSQTQALPEQDPNTTPAQQPSLNNDSGKKKPSQSKKSTPSKGEKPPSAADLAHIHLEGEEEEKVPIFDTCDDVRKKINEHLKGNTTQAGFCRELSEMMPNGSVAPNQLARFLKYKGPLAGAHSNCFYASYVYFEKLRLQQGKKKSAKRENVEEAWKKDGGFPREGSHNMHLFCRVGESWKLDSLGQIQICGTPSLFSGKISRKKARSR